MTEATGAGSQNLPQPSLPTDPIHRWQVAVATIWASSRCTSAGASRALGNVDLLTRS